MVEGPKYHRHAELLRTALVGRHLSAVRRAASELYSQLAPFVGCQVLRVLVIGKEILIIFSIRWDPLSEGSAIRLHFGHGGGYLVQPDHGEAWGPKAPGGGHRRQPQPQTQLEFGPAAADKGRAETGRSSATARRPPALRFLLWDELGSMYSVVTPEYIRSVEARSVFDINAAEDVFQTETAVRVFRESEELVVDLIMDQSRLPGVGNIIKCEGLFAARLHPLRRSSEIEEDQWRKLLAGLRDFSDRWYRHCQLSDNGQMMGCTHLMRVYGHRACVHCSGPVSLIKEGTRQRITYFCPQCQPDTKPMQTRRRPHRNEIPLRVPACLCGLEPALLQVRAGYYDGPTDNRRPYLSCAQRHGSSYDDGGCGVAGSWDGCGYRVWLDEVFELPKCSCSAPCAVRRVSGLRGNGEFFARCRQRACRFRCWLRVEAGAAGRLGTTGAPEAPTGAAAAEPAPAPHRWGRRFLPSGAAARTQVAAEREEIQLAMEASAWQRGKFCSSSSSEPVTSGDEETAPEEASTAPSGPAEELFALGSQPSWLKGCAPKPQAAGPPEIFTRQKRWAAKRGSADG